MTPTPIRILILVANPFDTAALTLDEEYQRIYSLWRSCDLRDQFKVHHCLATRAETFQNEVLQFKPHIIHFSGHGTENSVIFTDSTGYQTHEVSKSALANLFKLCAPDLKAVFLNACHSAINAEDIAEQVDYFIGMNDAIDDKAGTVFSQGFYSAIFNQNTLDIEQAFQAGLNQMEIAHITDAEQQLRVLQKRPKTYVPSYKHDIFISFADADTQWATNFINYLQKQLKSKLATFDDFQLCIHNDFSQLESSAMLLIIASPAYYQQYASQFEQLGNYAKRQPTFLIEITSYSIPSSLTGVSRQKFWHDDEQQGIQSLQGAAHIDKANQVAELVAIQLQDLKTKHQLQQHTEQQRQQQQAARNPDTKSIDAFIFLHSAPEDLNLTRDIVPLLEENGIDYVLPLARSIETTAEDIRQDIENHILNCDAILILYEQTTDIWVREQLGTCRRLQRRRDTPLKIIAVHQSRGKKDLNYRLENLRVYSCPPEKAQTYLPQFIKALSFIDNKEPVKNIYPQPIENKFMSKKKTILIVAANPSNESQLRLGEEVRDIDRGLSSAKHRDMFELEQQWATRVRDLRHAMQKHEPTIVHFCGHGSGEQGIVLEDNSGKTQLVSSEALANFFELFSDTVECVVLNACFSEIQAKEIVKYIPYVIGMSEGIGDKAAIEFAVAFYDSLASGKNYEKAYKFGCNAIEMEGISGHLIPQFLEKIG